MVLERLKDIVGRVSFRPVLQIWNLTLPGSWYCFLCLLHWVARWESWTWEAKNVLLSAPQLLLTREWKFFCPALCSHHRCQLQRYVSPPPPPPQPWYMYLKPFYQPMGRLHRAIWPSPCSQQGADASAFLRLPVELRNMIYVYASGANKYRIDFGDLATYHPRNGFEEDAISFQLIDDPIIALHGQNPPTNLLLVCKTIYHEARQQFLATTAFEVHPLTPRADSLAYGHLISLADYRAYVLLGTSVFASTMQKVRLRIDISRFLSSRVKRPCGPYDRLKIMSIYDEIGLKACTEMLTWGSKTLCKALKKSVPNLRLVEICWVDDFPDEISPQDLEMRASVLQPFSTLEFVDVRVKDLVIPRSGRKEVSKMIKECLGVGPQPEPGGYLFLGVDKL